jgi:hypothetical protein
MIREVPKLEATSLIPTDFSIREKELTAMLIDMTNEYIDYRNQVFDSSCNMLSFTIEMAEDYKYVYDMDTKITNVKEFLEEKI